MQNEDYTGLFLVADCALAVLNAGFACWYAAKGDPFCIISVAACGISVYGAVSMLRYRKKRKHLVEDHERVMQQLDALHAYYEQMREITYSNHPKKRGRGRVAHLAETHRKERVRKKNKRRMREK